MAQRILPNVFESERFNWSWMCVKERRKEKIYSVNDWNRTFFFLLCCASSNIWTNCILHRYEKRFLDAIFHFGETLVQVGQQLSASFSFYLCCRAKINFTASTIVLDWFTVLDGGLKMIDNVRPFSSIALRSQIRMGLNKYEWKENKLKIVRLSNEIIKLVEYNMLKGFNGWIRTAQIFFWTKIVCVRERGRQRRKNRKIRWNHFTVWECLNVRELYFCFAKITSNLSFVDSMRLNTMWKICH